MGAKDICNCPVVTNTTGQYTQQFLTQRIKLESLCRVFPQLKISFRDSESVNVGELISCFFMCVYRARIKAL